MCGGGYHGNLHRHECCAPRLRAFCIQQARPRSRLLTSPALERIPPGTLPIAINASPDVTGSYVDSPGVYHGFMRAADGTVTPGIDAAQCGRGRRGQGLWLIDTSRSASIQRGMSPAYMHTNGVHYEFVYTASAGSPEFPAFDVTGAVTTGLFAGNPGQPEYQEYRGIL